MCISAGQKSTKNILAKVRPITFDPFNNAYHVVGEKVGDAWGSGKKFMWQRTTS
jgi:hypothetical protein